MSCFLRSLLVILSFFSCHGWESWDVEYQPPIPEDMPFLIDDDVRFEDGPGAPRACTVANRWLRGLPSSEAIQQPSLFEAALISEESPPFNGSPASASNAIPAGQS